MTDYYKTNKEVMADYEKEALKYKQIRNQIRKDIKKYKTLTEVTQNEDYKLAYSMLADYLEDLEEG